MTRRWILVLYLIPAVLLAGGSLPFLFSDLDMDIARQFYNEKAKLWTLSDKSPWLQLHRFGAIPALVTAVLALSVLVLGIGRHRFVSSRKLSAFLVLSLIIGPGLIADFLLQENWGRPQPYEIVGLGGANTFERLLKIDPTTEGHSFVSGLASTGFYFFACGLTLIACRRRKTGILVIVAAGTYGATIGMACIVQGTHFASDVLWSAGVAWFASAGLFHIFGLHRKALYEPKKDVAGHIPPWARFGILVALLATIGTTCLAYPYSRINTTTLVSEKLERLPDTIHITLDLEGSLVLAGGDKLLLETESRGIGFPRAKLRNKRIFITDGSEVVHRRSGHFTKLNVHNRIILPPNRVYRITLGKRVSSVGVLPPGKESQSGHFAHVWLTSGFGTKLLTRGSKAGGEDFFGRRTRSFRVE
ncbi:MAG: phosphatase PAP2 family protein [Roseibacillus sp.]|nr:phosphatase PAP2 family protein [Roseibacillus sp.]